MLRSMIGNIDAVADIIPVDTCSNMMVTLAWHTACKRYVGGKDYTAKRGPDTQPKRGTK